MTGAYVLRRFLHALLVLFGVSLGVFVIAHLSGDPAALMVQPDATREHIEALRKGLGLDRPLPEQFLSFLLGALRGDFGNSLWQKQPALPLVLDRMPATLQLTVAAMVISVSVAVPSGVLAALNRGSINDRLVMLVALLGQAMPGFWLGLMLILLFSLTLGWLPTSGRGGLEHLILPAISLGAFSMARTGRLVRSGLIEILGQDYVRTARAKGLRERAVLVKHALRNALIPVVTVLGMEFGILFSGAVIIETVFAWPGVGRLAVQAIFQRDFPLVQATVFVSAVGIVAVNFFVDMLYTFIDPRIKYA